MEDDEEDPVVVEGEMEEDDPEEKGEYGTKGLYDGEKGS